MTVIFHCIVGLNRGGAEFMLYKLLKNSVDKKTKNIVVSMTAGGDISDRIKALGVPIYFLNMKKDFSLAFGFFKYMKIIKKYKPDIVQSWMNHANLLSVIAWFFSPGYKVIFNIRQTLYSIHQEKRLTRFVIYANAFFSRFVKYMINNSEDSIVQHNKIGFVKDRWVYIENGFDLTKFKPNDRAKIAFRRRHSLAENAILIGIVARFHFQKNQYGFVTIANLIMKSSDKNIYFLIAGDGCTENNKTLLKWLEDAGISHRVFLLGKVDSEIVLPVLDLYLSVSLIEGFPNIIGEALSCGVPCVATDVGDCKKIIQYYGGVAKAGDYQSLADLCLYHLNNNLKSVDEMRSYIRENYSIEKISRKYQDLYNKVVCESAKCVE